MPQIYNGHLKCNNKKVNKPNESAQKTWRADGGSQQTHCWTVNSQMRRGAGMSHVVVKVTWKAKWEHMLSLMQMGIYKNTYRYAYKKYL